jgi:hypothetical protein
MTAVVGAAKMMTGGSKFAVGSQPKPLAVGFGVLLLIAGIWYGLVFPLDPYSADLQRHLAILVLRVLHLAFVVTLLQIGLGFALAGGNAAAEIRCRTCVFSTVVVLVMVIGVAMVVVWHPITYDDLRWDLYGERTWHMGRHVFLLCAVPVLSGLCVHSGLYTASDLRRQEPRARNRVAAYLIVATLALGSSAAAAVVGLCVRVQSRETADYREAYTALWQGTDRMTRRFAKECPGDYHFLLLRANFLQDAGRPDEAGVMYRQVCEATNVPEHIRQNVEVEMERNHHTRPR